MNSKLGLVQSYVLTKYFSYCSQVVGDSSCCFIVDNAHRLNGVCSVGSKLRCQDVEIGALAPLTFDDIHIEAKALLLINPE